MLIASDQLLTKIITLIGYLSLVCDKVHGMLNTAIDNVKCDSQFGLETHSIIYNMEMDEGTVRCVINRWFTRCSVLTLRVYIIITRILYSKVRCFLGITAGETIT